MLPIAASRARVVSDPARRAGRLALAAVLVLATSVSAEPRDFQALLASARALNAEMAERTNGNLPLVDGLQDGPEHRAIWAELGPRALADAREAVALRPDSVEAAAALANAYMFYASSLGILRSILKGASGEYREHARRLVELDPTYEDGLGDYLLASFYLVAPWPLADKDAAFEHYQRAAVISPYSVRNQYGLAVFWARQRDVHRAHRHFEEVATLPCNANTERLFCDWMKQEARRVLGDPAEK